MNNTGHNRWGRYKIIGGIPHKLCNGPHHSPEGAFLPLRSFWIHKSGPRTGKPFSRCIECLKTEKGRDPLTSGYIRIAEVWWVFLELRNRLGKAEALRRVGISTNFWMRAERGIYIHVRKATVKKALETLIEARANNEVRHRDSIKYGALARGRQDKPVEDIWHDIYVRHGDGDSENRRKSRKTGSTS